MKRPLVILTLIFCLGIFIASKIRIYFWWVYVLALISLVSGILSFKKGLAFDILLLSLAFLLGVLGLINSKVLPKCHVYKFTSYKSNDLYTIKGFVNNQPVTKINRTAFIFKVQEIQSGNFRQNCCGDILVYIRGKRELCYGEELVLIGNLYRPYRFGLSKQQSYRDYLYRQGIFSIMQARHIYIAAKANRGRMVQRFALYLKGKMQDLIFKYTSSITASILDAMILGEKRNIPVPIYNSMIKSGTVHILVVSGFNVGIVTLIIILFLRLLRIPRRARFGVAFILLMLYCLMTGASTPVLRATIMAIVFMFAYFVKRQPDIYNSCAVAAIFILSINPQQLFDIGFQLSFVSVLSIVCLYPKIKSFLHVDVLRTRYLRFIIDGCLVSFSAWLGTMGFIAYYFKLFSPVTALANIFIVPLATLITLSGFSLIAIGLICSPLASLFALPCELLATLLLQINAILIKIPHAYVYLSR